MHMRYYLTEAQFKNLWDKIDADAETKFKLKTFQTMRDHRYKLWAKHFRDKYKLLYTETKLNEEYRCCVLGTEDRINWFLLQV